MLNTDFEVFYHLNLDPTTFEAGCDVNTVSFPQKLPPIQKLISKINYFPQGATNNACAERAATNALAKSYAEVIFQI